MYIHPKAKALLDIGKANPIYTRPIDDARTLMAASQMNGRILEPVKEILNFEVTSLNGHIPVREYIPENCIGNKAYIFIHGGGWSLNNLETAEEGCLHIANLTGRKVFSIEYRLAPEYRFPAGLQDCIEAVQWIFDNAINLGIDSSHICIGGDSSGATYSASICQYFNDRGGVKIEKQVLVYPSTDYWLPGTKSLVDNDPYSIVDRNFIIWAWGNYVANPVDPDMPYLCPARAKNFKGLPPAIVITADCDPLRDEGILYAEKLKEAGVDVTHINYPGMMHGFYLKFRIFEEGADAHIKIAEFLKD